MTRSLDDLRTQIDALADRPPSETARAWQALKHQVEVFCKNLERGDSTAARDALPILADLITRLDQVIEGMERDNPVVIK